jgi:S1-C subfamily serine protease
MIRILLLILCLIPTIGHSQDQRPYVGRVVSERADGASMGSCVLIDDNLVLTNWHVVTRSTGLLLQFKDNQQRVGKVLKSDRIFDLALVQFDEPLVGIHRVGIGDSEDWSTTCGFKFGREYYEMTGKILGLVEAITVQGGRKKCVTKDGEPAMFVFAGEVFPGMSGGPMIGPEGYLTGLVWGTTPADKNEGAMTFGTRVSAILEFLEGTEYQPKVFGK